MRFKQTELIYQLPFEQQKECLKLEDYKFIVYQELFLNTHPPIGMRLGAGSSDAQIVLCCG